MSSTQPYHPWWYIYSVPGVKTRNVTIRFTR